MLALIIFHSTHLRIFCVEWSSLTKIFSLFVERGFFVDDRPCARLRNRNLEFISAHIEYPYTTHTHTTSLSAPLSRCHVAGLDACLFEIRRQLGMAAQWASAGHRRDGGREWEEGKREGEREGEKTGCHMRQRADSRKERGGDGEQREREECLQAPRVYKYVCVFFCVPAW